MSSSPTPADTDSATATATATDSAPGTDGAPIPPPVTAVPARDRRSRDPQLLAVLFFTAYATLSVCRWRHLATRSWDLGIFEQAVRAYAYLRAPVADLRGPGSNLLGDHFSPVTALLAPAYRLFPTPVTLLVAQAALLGLSAVPVTRAAARLLGRSRGLALGLAYGLSWGIQRAVDFDFHEICFAVPLIAFALEAVLERRWRAALLWAFPLVLVKEDLGLTLAAIALVVAVRARKPAPRTALCALGVAVLGVLAAVLTFTVVIPAFNTADTYTYWNKAGGDPLDGLGTKLRTLAWLLIPTTGLLAVRSPLLLVALPTLGWRLLSSDRHYWGTEWHYSAVLMPVLSLALADALSRARWSPRPWLRSYALHLPTAVVAAALALTTSLPLSVLGESAAYRKPARVSAVERLLARVPDGASVEANVGPSSRLVARCRVFWPGGTGGVTPDFIALDDSDHAIQDVQAYAGRLHPHAAYDVVGAAYGYVLLERRT
ncbi:DUF2079 domain-containing protein [Streptomyces mirabilis]|uniref:DUF2079 domain-containing protein n=1 Tax=Streptomyces mirabilis TaxID=68239 RepID=UPI0036409046